MLKQICEWNGFVILSVLSNSDLGCMTYGCLFRFAFKSEFNLQAKVLALWVMKNNKNNKSSEDIK